MRLDFRAGRSGDAWPLPAVGGRPFVVSLLVLSLLSGSAVGVAGQFSVSPAMLHVESSGEVETLALEVENVSDASVQLQVYLADHDRELDGGHRYLPFGEHERSCAGHLQAFPEQLDLAAGASQQVRIRLEAPDRPCWGTLFVERKTLTPSGITVAQRIGVKVMVERPGLRREGEVVGMTADTAEGPGALLEFHNTGERILEVDGEVEVRSFAGEVVAVAPVERFLVLPDRRRRIRVPIQVPLEPGRYILVGILDFKGDYLAGGQALLEVK